MGLFDAKTGDSWFKIIFNPIGYSAKRESIDTAVTKYYNANPPLRLFNYDPLTDTGINESDLIITGQRWVDGCTAVVKSEDVGKSKSNVAKACQQKWDQDGSVISEREKSIELREMEQAAAKAETMSLAKNIILLIGALIFICVIVYLLISK